MQEKSREQRVRRVASKQGVILKKSRTRIVHASDKGGYALTDAKGRFLAGKKFELSLDDVERYLGMGEH